MKIEILLSTYNSEKYLYDQLNSLFSQTNQDFFLTVRDDKSNDNTSAIICDFINLYPRRIRVLSSDRNLGAKGSFMELLKQASGDYIMFCDHDDVWYPDKVQITLDRMLALEKEYSKKKPILIHTDLEIVDENLNTMAKSFYSAPLEDLSFSQRLVGNTVVGCTVMINKALKDIIRYTNDERFLMHDYWTALAASAFGIVSYIDQPTIKYRQHGTNAIGYNNKLNVFHRMQYLFKLDEIRSKFQRDYDHAALFLEVYRDMLSPEQINILKVFLSLHNVSTFERAKLLKQYHFDYYYGFKTARISQILFM